MQHLRGLAGVDFKEMHDLLDDLHGGCCHSQQLPELAAGDDPFAELMLELIGQVWSAKGMPEGLINKAVSTAFYKKLWSGVESGYGLSFDAVDYDTPDFKMLKSLQDNVWHFSAAKNYTQLRELSNALINTDGKLRTFNEFKLEAFKINSKHINQYLKAEYELAVTGAQMTSKWVDITENKESLPLLMFDAVIDTQTTDLCRSLNGTILPVDDPFWSTYYLPNHFGERSTVRQLSSGKITPKNKIPSAEIPAMFKTNLAKDGLIYPASHPYFIDNPASIKTAKNG